MKFSTVSAVVLGAALQASAQSLTVISTAFGGPGCPQSSGGPTISVSSGAISYTPPTSTFFARTTPITDTRRNCQINVNADIPAGFRFRLSQSTIPVTASTPSGNSEAVDSTYFFSSAASATGTGSTTVTSTGPSTVVNTFSPATVWSACGGNAIVNINTALRATGSGAGSITGAGTINTAIVWQAC